MNIPEDKHAKDVDISIIDILENYSPDRTFTGTFKYPPSTMLHEFIAVYSHCNILCTIKVGDEECHLLPSNGSPEPINLETFADTFDVKIEFLNVEEYAIVSNVMIELLSLKAVPVKVDDIKTIMNPEQGISIALDFTDALNVACGEDECIEKIVQIRMPNGTIVTFNNPSQNFYWRKDILYCRLPSGYEHTARINYVTQDSEIDSQVGWSDWFSFTPRRKMTL